MTFPENSPERLHPNRIEVVYIIKNFPGFGTSASAGGARILHEKIINSCIAANPNYRPTVLVTSPQENCQQTTPNFIRGDLDTKNIIAYLKANNHPQRLLYLADSLFVFHEPEALLEISSFWEGLVVWRPPQIHRLSTTQEKLGPDLPRIFGNINHFISQSAEMAYKLIQMGVDISKITTIDNGTDTSVFHPFEHHQEKLTARKPLFPSLTEEAVIYTYVGRLYQEKKRVSDFVSAWQASNLASLGHALLLVGPYANGIPGIDDTSEFSRLNILITGEVDQEDVAQYLRISDVFVLPTIPEGEGFSNSLLEAAASGCAVVARNGTSGASRIVVEGETGYMFDDVSHLSTILCMLLDKRLNMQLGINAVNRVRQNFTLEHMAAQHLDLYKKLLKIEH